MFMSKFVIGAEKNDSPTGEAPTDAMWIFELEEYGFDDDTTLSGNYFLQLDSCLKESE
jgi:hypothetical protein